MRNSNVDILEEIDEQKLGEISAGTITVATYTLASWALGNDGHLCTATVECMENC